MLYTGWTLLLGISPWSVESFVPACLAPVQIRQRAPKPNHDSKQLLQMQSLLGDAEYDNDEDLFDGFDDEDGTDTNQSREDQLLDFAIDSFLRGDYEYQFADDAPAPHPGLTPQATVEAALQSLRHLDDPEPSHGAAVLMRFCVPLSRGERWGGGNSSAKQQSEVRDPVSWKEILRGAITPTMLARRIRASDFSCLLDWSDLDVTEGAFSVKRDDGIELGLPSSVAFVNAALYFGDGAEPVLVQFTLRKIHGVWLIDSARLSAKELFV